MTCPSQLPDYVQIWLMNSKTPKKMQYKLNHKSFIKLFYHPHSRAISLRCHTFQAGLAETV